VSPGILYFGATPGDFGINLSLGDACTPGCPSGSLTILASATDGTRAETLAAQALEAPGAVNFDFSATGSRALVEYPRPHATSVTRLGDQVFIGLFIPPVSVYDDAGSGITGFNILTATASSDPGRSPGAYTLNTHVPSPGGSGVTANVTGLCPSGGQDDVWLAVQITTSAGASSLVSQSFRIHCHILAEPTRRIDKRMGTQTDN
jgi:hypothetical protein